MYTLRVTIERIARPSIKYVRYVASESLANDVIQHIESNQYTDETIRILALNHKGEVIQNLNIIAPELAA